MVTKEIDIKQTQIKSCSHHGDTLTGKPHLLSLKRQFYKVYDASMGGTT